MNKTIWKFKIDTKNINNLEMPIGSEILSIQEQIHEGMCMWALVDPSLETEIRAFETFGTGHEIYYDMGVSRKYIDTYQLQQGALVFHVFERLD